MINESQIRAARAHLDWSQKQLAAAAGVALISVKRLERPGGVAVAKGATVRAVQRALEQAGVRFLLPDYATGTIRRGLDWFSAEDAFDDA